MENLEIRPYQHSDEKAVTTLWMQCHLIVPWNNPKRDIERKLKVNPELFLVGVLDGKVVGTCMAGYEGHRGWINYLAVAPEYQRRGIAAKLMEVTEKKLKELGCPKINLQVRASNTGVISFYEQIGFKVEQIVNMGKRLDVDPEFNIEQFNQDE
jgi:ribosomal protein S18 acetylase RimI-like enzyme